MTTSPPPPPNPPVPDRSQPLLKPFVGLFQLAQQLVLGFVFFFCTLAHQGPTWLQKQLCLKVWAICASASYISDLCQSILLFECFPATVQPSLPDHSASRSGVWCASPSFKQPALPHHPHYRASPQPSLQALVPGRFPNRSISSPVLRRNLAV